MAINRNNTKVKDVYFGTLPPEWQSKIVNVCKIINDTLNIEFKRDLYDELRASNWAKSTIDHFVEKPKDKYIVGSCRIFKTGNTYKATIYVTTKFPNKEYGWMEELMHGFLQNVFIESRKVIRKRFDLTLINDGDHGSDTEGFSISLNNRDAKYLWEKLEDIPEKKYINEFTTIPCLYEKMKSTQDLINNTIEKIVCEKDFSNLFESSLLGSLSDDIHLESLENNNGELEYYYIPLTEEVVFNGTHKEMEYSKELYSEIAEKVNDRLDDDTKEVVCVVNEDGYPSIWTILNDDYALLLENKLKQPPKEDFKNPEDKIEEKSIKSNNTIDSIAKDIIEKKKVTQSDLNICAEVINKNYFSKWAKFFNRVNLRLVDNNESTLSYKIPPINNKVVSDLINGKTTIFMYLHRSGNIDIKISSKALLTMTEPHQLFKFLESAIKYYASRVNRYGVTVLSPIMKFPRPVKQLICDGKLDGVIRIPLVMLFNFNDIDLTKDNNFKMSRDDFKAIRKFSSGVISAYNTNKENKDQVIKLLKKIIADLRKHVHTDDKNLLKGISENVEDFYDGKFDRDMEFYKNKWISENTLDYKISPDSTTRYYAETFGVKKLKKIPMSTVAYVQIEGESIKNANDKYMIAAYCLAKLELVEWYIELINTNSKKYIVPHTKQYLETMRNSLLKAYNEIMKRPIPSADKPLFDLKQLESASDEDEDPL